MAVSKVVDGATNPPPHTEMGIAPAPPGQNLLLLGRARKIVLVAMTLGKKPEVRDGHGGEKAKRHKHHQPDHQNERVEWPEIPRW